MQAAPSRFPVNLQVSYVAYAHSVYDILHRIMCVVCVTINITMSLLRVLLQAKEPLFDESLRQLEAASHKQGVDISLTADIHKSSSRAMRQLGLDPADTTGAELYSALVGQAKVHDQHLAKCIGILPSTTAQGALELIKDAVAAVPLPRDVWVLKKERRQRHAAPYAAAACYEVAWLSVGR